MQPFKIQCPAMQPKDTAITCGSALRNPCCSVFRHGCKTACKVNRFRDLYLIRGLKKSSFQYNTHLAVPQNLFWQKYQKNTLNTDKYGVWCAQEFLVRERTE
jgi:hypothetical protein